jgi:hypothetical protein
MSLACAVHCACLPLLSGVLAATHVLESPWVEVGMLGTASGIGVVTLRGGFRRHRRILPYAMLGAGMAILFFGHFQEGHPMALSLLGALLLVTAQVADRRFAATCADGCCSADA